MKLPEWYWRERAGLVKRRHQMELEAEEVDALLTDHVIDKDADFLRVVVHAWVSRDTEQALRRLASAEVRKRRSQVERTAERAVTEAEGLFTQPTLDADIFPGADSTTPLEEDEKWLKGYKDRTERYIERHKLLRETFDRLLSAVGGDRMATRAEAKEALRQLGKTRRALGG